MDWAIFVAIVALMLFSISFVYSASASFADLKFGSSEKLFINHAIRVLIAFVVLIVFSRIDYHHIREFTRPMMVLSILCLIYVLVMESRVKGAARWIYLGAFSFQPSELAKFALLFHVSRILADYRDRLHDIKRGVMPVLAWAMVICALVAAQPNLSTSLVIFFLVFTLLFLAGAKFTHLSAIGFSALVAAGVYAIGAEYRMQRLSTFLHGSDDAMSPARYQLDQALLAFGNGGLFGVGPGQSHQRDWFLPEPFGDFIYSIVGEEYGYIGAALIIIVFAIILWRGFVIARRAPDDFGYYLAAGVSLTLAAYAFVNAGVTCGLLPTTGLPMPFISYGGTSVIFSAMAVGILLNISRQSLRSTDPAA